MRTTIAIADDLLVEAKQAALDSGQSLGELVEDALRERLGRRGAAAPRVPLPVSPAGLGLRPGVDLDDSAALLDLMDGLAEP